MASVNDLVELTDDLCRAASMETCVKSKSEENKHREEEVDSLQKKVKEVERELDAVQSQLSDANARYDTADKRVANVKSSLRSKFTSHDPYFRQHKNYEVIQTT